MKMNFQISLRPSVLLILVIVFTSCHHSTTKQTAMGYESRKVEQSKATFDNARELQHEGDLEQAIRGFANCLKYKSADKSTVDSLYPILSNALLQLMNSYQAAGKVEECTDCFGKIYRCPPPMIRKYCLRDLRSIYAYALYRNDKMDEAEAMIEKALATRYYIKTHENLFRDYSYAAAIYYCLPSKQELLMHYGLLALRESELCTHTSGAQWLLTMLAETYNLRGEIDKAVSLHERAIKIATQKKDTLGTAHAYKGLANIYIEWDLYDKANECASMAISVIGDDRRYPDIIASIYTCKACCLYAMERVDSMYYYLDKAARYCKDLPYGNGQVYIDYMKGVAMTEKAGKDSLARGIALLDTVARKSYQKTKNKAFYSLAKAYIREGDNKMGTAMLDSMYAMTHTASQTYYVKGANLYALRYFMRLGDNTRAMQYAKMLSEEKTYEQSAVMTQKLADLYVKMNTEKKDSQLKYYKMKSKNGQMHFFVFASVSLAFIILICAILLYKRKVYRMNTMLMNERLENLTKKMQTEMANHQETKEVLSKIIKDNSHKDLDLMSAEVLTSEGEKEFVKYFRVLHPTFLDKLDKRCNTLGHREILCCMLIALKQDNHQISEIMCIAYRSVIMARYRIKQKMSLSEEESIEDVIYSLCDET
jgi:tetratricopeptide (TPR) repeat protein